MKPKATNNFVFVIRDKSESETGGLLIPGIGREKPHYGVADSVGSLVGDKNIRKGKKVMFHKGVGFEIEYEGIVYLVIEGERIISVLDPNEK
jgi:co-chaperonin GroES (HSP10)